MFHIALVRGGIRYEQRAHGVDESISETEEPPALVERHLTEPSSGSADGANDESDRPYKDRGCASLRLWRA